MGWGARHMLGCEVLARTVAEIAVLPQLESDERDAYDRLLGEAMHGYATLLARQDVVEASWRLVDPLLDTHMSPDIYEKGTWGPASADQLTRTVGGWSNPQ